MAAISTMDPKLGAQMLLAILFYNNIFTRKDISRFTMLLKLLTMLPTLASQSVMIPLVVQTILPMLQKDAKPEIKVLPTSLSQIFTAWDVIRKHVLDYTVDPNLAQSLSFLLRWGAMDAEAHPEVSKDILQILWSVSISTHPGLETQWAKARASSFEAMAQFEVSHTEQTIQDFKKRNLVLLSCESNITVLNAMEELLVKIITHEHLTRRRLVKEKRVAGSKIEKMLDVFPQVNVLHLGF
ncbi:hypothetical protein ACLB2K_053933 [Fragaria x ananassa]